MLTIDLNNDGFDKFKTILFELNKKSLLNETNNIDASMFDILSNKELEVYLMDMVCTPENKPSIIKYFNYITTNITQSSTYLSVILRVLIYNLNNNDIITKKLIHNYKDYVINLHIKDNYCVTTHLDVWITAFFEIKILPTRIKNAIIQDVLREASIKITKHEFELLIEKAYYNNSDQYDRLLWEYYGP